MRNGYSIIAAAAALALLSGCYAPSQSRAAWAPGLNRPASTAPATRTEARPAQILVKFKAGMRMAEIQAFRAEYGTRNVGYIQGIDVYVEEVTSRKPVGQILEEMNASPLVEYAELNGEVGIGF